MSKILFSFEKFELYQRSLEFTNNMYLITKKLPINEQFGLSSQLRRAAMSVSLNLAEGFGYFHAKEKNRFFRIAKGSVFECIPGLTLSLKQKYIDRDDFDKMYQECFELSKMISGLMKYIGNKKKIDSQFKKI
jgi:four helix bundle protein